MLIRHPGLRLLLRLCLRGGEPRPQVASTGRPAETDHRDL